MFGSLPSHSLQLVGDCDLGTRRSPLNRHYMESSQLSSLHFDEAITRYSARLSLYGIGCWIGDARIKASRLVRQFGDRAISQMELDVGRNHLSL